MELVRELLFTLEAKPPKAFLVDELHIAGREVPEIRYHMLLLGDIGFVELGDKPLLASDFVVRRLTWAGSDFLSSIRSDNVWNGVKQRLAGDLQAIGFAALQTVISEVAKQTLSGVE